MRVDENLQVPSWTCDWRAGERLRAKVEEDSNVLRFYGFHLLVAGRVSARTMAVDGSYHIPSMRRADQRQCP